MELFQEGRKVEHWIVYFVGRLLVAAVLLCLNCLIVDCQRKWIEWECGTGSVLRKQIDTQFCWSICCWLCIARWVVENIHTKASPSRPTLSYTHFPIVSLCCSAMLPSLNPMNSIKKVAILLAYCCSLMLVPSQCQEGCSLMHCREVENEMM